MVPENTFVLLRSRENHVCFSSRDQRSIDRSIDKCLRQKTPVNSVHGTLSGQSRAPDCLLPSFLALEIHSRSPYREGIDALQ